jgi:3,4-dihydroxy 2-butanone 4-phosphate synthase/GTP cyclohydrolase II
MPNEALTDVAESTLATRRGMFRAVAFRERSGGPEHLALVHGDPRPGQDVLVRVHSECLTGDVFDALRCDCGAQLSSALDAIVAEGTGVLVYLRGHEGRGIGLVAKVRTHVLQDEQGLDTVDSATALGLPVDVRDFGAAARVLHHLGVTSVRLLSNNADKVDALTGHGVAVAARVPLLEPVTEQNVRYLTAKRDRLGHDLPHLDPARRP